MEIILLVIMIFGIFWIGYLAVDRCGRFTDKNYKEIDSSAANHSVLVINQGKECEEEIEKELETFINPDTDGELDAYKKKKHQSDFLRMTLRDTFIMVMLLIASTGLGLIFTWFGFSESNIITVFILGVLIISVTTVSPFYSLIGSLASVLLFNWFFIAPKFSFHTYETEYAVTFAIMLISALITGTLAGKLKENARSSALEAFRVKVLFDTNQLLQGAGNTDDAIRITAGQIKKLVSRNVAVYPVNKNGALGEAIICDAGGSEGDIVFEEENERKTAEKVFHDRRDMDTSSLFNDGGSQYHAISINGHCYGVVCIRSDNDPLDDFEHSVLMSIIGECALTLENIHNEEEKKKASDAARNEQIRSNLLRSISHDIRTPLTSISGNASNLLYHYTQMDDEMRSQIFSDIYNDSEWLIELVENLLSISRLENGQMTIHLSVDILNDVIEESLKHIDGSSVRHHITVSDNEMILVKMDTRLIMQVLINLVNNAIKNTQIGSEIHIRSEKKDKYVMVSVIDNGPGIPDEIKPHIFELFYTGQNKVADGRRGLGLGLALCKSIIEAHNGTITLTDNKPSGCCFTFSLPLVEEVNTNEQIYNTGRGG